MSGSITVNSDTFQVTTASDNEIRMTRLFHFWRQLVASTR